MRALRFAIAAIAVGCNQTPDGLLVEVVIEDSSIETVELILAAGCDGCVPKMGAPMVAPRDANVFDTIHDNVWFAAKQGDVAGFELRADGDTEQLIHRLAVVGFDASKRAVAIAVRNDVLVPAGPGEYWQMRLTPITPIEDTTAVLPDGTVRHAVWRDPEQPEPSCVMIEEWSGGKPVTSGLRPRTDPDCDHVLANECAPYQPDAASAPGGVETTRCWLPDPTLDGACTSGAPMCTDGAPTMSGECLQIGSDYCVPNDLCTCTSSTLSCLVDLFLDHVETNQVPHVSCQVYVSPVTGALCPGGPSTVDIDLGPLLASGTTCDAVSLLIGYADSYDAYYTDKFAVGTTANIGLHNLRPACALDLTWSGTYDTPGGLYINGHMLDLDLSNGKHIMIPMRVDLTSVACDNIQVPLLCVASKGVDTTDRISSCSRP